MTARRRSGWRALRIPMTLGFVLAVVAGVSTYSGESDVGALGPPHGGTTWYVDCSAASAGDGSRAAPFNSLQSANQLTLGPGDQVLLRRGTVCPGMLEPRGNGAPGDPILIGAYPAGPSRSLPTISGGGTVTAAVWLADVSDVIVEDLQLTNAGDSVGIHRGLYFTSDTGPVRDVTVRHLEVDDVDSNNSFNGGKQGGGIVGQALSSAGRFSNVLIEDNDVHDVSRQGITIYGTTSDTRPPATSPWPQASTGVVIQGNTVERVQGDGIVPLGTNGALVQYNLVERGNLAGYDFLSPNKNCAAGIWAWDANNTVIQYNEVSHMVYGPSTDPSALNGCDGEGFDADYNQDGTVIQYNYSHDNAGGFMLLCTDQSPHRIVIRYNLSVNDNATFNPTPCAGVIDPSTNNLDGVEMYNNTIVAPTPRVTLELNESLGQALISLLGSFEFQNNIVDATSADAPNHYFSCGIDCTNNLFSGLPVPSGATNSVTGRPLFLAPSERGSGFFVANAFRLRPGSPAIGAGVAIPAGFPPPATHDFFGVPIGDPPSIGFSEGVGVGP
jgi:Right handed beta helix region